MTIIHRVSIHLSKDVQINSKKFDKKVISQDALFIGGVAVSAQLTSDTAVLNEFDMISFAGVLSQ